MDALDVQVGGDHYKKTPYQPVKFAVDLRLNFIQGNIVKYATRYKDKNGKQDLEKVIHYAQLGQQLDPANYSTFNRGMMDKYFKQNNLGETVVKIVEAAVYQSWLSVIANVGELIKQEYGTVH